MKTVAEKVRSARRRSELTTRELAALAGTTSSTISRVETGAQQPGADAYVRILRAAGFADDGQIIRRLAFPDATWAARWVLGDLDVMPPGAEEWIDAWRRINLVADDGAVPDFESLFFRAGNAAPIASRPGVVISIARLEIPAIAETLESAGVDYAVTGDYALARLGMPLAATHPVVYVDGVKDAAKALGLTPRFPGELGPVVTLLPFDGFSEKGRVQAEGDVRFASAIQVALDGYGGYGRMVEQASLLVRRWEAR